MSSTGRRLPGPPVRAVLFDYGMTLVTVSRPSESLQRAYESIAALLTDRLDRSVPAAAALLAAVHDRVDAAVAQHDASYALEEIDLAPVYGEAYAALGLPLPVDLLDEAQRLEQRAWFDGMALAESAVATLTELRGRGLRLGLCSNAPYHPASMRAQLQHLGLLDHLDAAVFSSEIGWRKPSPRIFEHALGVLGGEPAATLMVGDRVREDIEGARAAGMRAVLLREHRREDDPRGLATMAIERLDELLELVAAPPA